MTTTSPSISAPIHDGMNNGTPPRLANSSLRNSSPNISTMNGSGLHSSPSYNALGRSGLQSSQFGMNTPPLPPRPLTSSMPGYGLDSPYSPYGGTSRMGYGSTGYGSRYAPRYGAGGYYNSIGQGGYS